jgi:hypothetical protein
MKHLPTFEQFINEDWNPNSKYSYSYLDDKADLEDESTVKQFVEFNGLPKLIDDIWLYAKKNLHKYPSKITTAGMVYSAKDSCNVELEFRKNQNEIKIWKFKIGSRNTEITSDLVKASDFNFKAFADMIEK